MQKRNRVIAAVLLAVIAVLSFAVIAPSAEDPQSKMNAETIRQLDEKEKDTLKLAAGAAGASIAVAAVPGDATTPIAEKFADVSSYFLIILCVIFVEKYLVTIFGLLAFRIIIPLACLLGFLYLIRGKELFRQYAMKAGAFAIILYLLMPSGVLLSNVVQNTYDEVIKDGIEAAEMASDETYEEEEEDQSFLDKIKDKVTSGVSGVVDRFTDYVKDMIEAAAVMIITTCVIPLLVLAAFLMIVRLLFHIDISGGRTITSLFRSGKKIRKRKTSGSNADE